MNTTTIKNAKQFAQDMMDDAFAVEFEGSGCDPERTAYQNEYDTDMELAARLNGEE